MTTKVVARTGLTLSGKHLASSILQWGLTLPMTG